VVSVIISPSHISLLPGQSQQFTATVANSANREVTWTISPDGAGTISSAGLYMAPATIAAQQTVTVTATSQADSSKSNTSTVTLMIPVSVSVTPQSATLYESQSQQFTATVADSTNTAVTWTISPDGAGTISETGLYTAPATIPAQQTVTVTATSQADRSKSGTSTINLMASVSVSVTPQSATLYGGQSQQFTATVANTTNTAVIWAISPVGEGTISAAGLYTAPATIAEQQTVIVTATSQADSYKSGISTVTLMAPVSVSITPPSVTLYGGQSQQFTAKVANSTNTAVSWTINPVGEGTISAAGLYTAPAMLAAQKSVTVTATSQANSSKSGASIVTAMTGVDGILTLRSQRIIGSGGLCGAFTDGSGSLIEAISIGALQREFLVPQGATQLQLGVSDSFYMDNVGPGFIVAVNQTQVMVPPTAMPWNWNKNGLNANYPFGLNNGTPPVVAVKDLKPGTVISIAYQSGTIKLWKPLPSFGADGALVSFAGPMSQYQGTFSPTLYMTGVSNPIGLNVPIIAHVTNNEGLPMLNVPVMLEIAGANPGDYEATTNSSGDAAFAYAGINAGTDTIKALASLNGETSPVSRVMSITWVNEENYTSLPKLGKLLLKPTLIPALPQNSQQNFVVVATDASGVAMPNLAITVYGLGVDEFQIDLATDSQGSASFKYGNISAGLTFVVASASIGGLPVFSDLVGVPGALPPPRQISSGGGGGPIEMSFSVQNTVTLPSTLQLSATATDSSLPVGGVLSAAWSQVSGPGVVTFSSPNGLVTSAAFSLAGKYLLQLNVSDSVNSNAVDLPVTVNAIPEYLQGLILAPVNSSIVSGLVPITLGEGTTLLSGTLTYRPVGSDSEETVLNDNTAGSGQIGMMDASKLANGSYWIELKATGSNGKPTYALVLVTVANGPS